MSAYYVPLISLPDLVIAPADYLTRGGDLVTIVKVSSKHDHECAGFYTASGTTERWHKSGRILASSETRNDIIRRVGTPQGRVVQPGGMTKQLQKHIKAAVKSAEVATTCEWLVSEGYASDIAHARELVDSAHYE